MHFESNFLYAVAPGKCGSAIPVGNDNFFPLILEDVKVIGWPRACDTIRGLIRGRPSGTAAEGRDDIHAELRGQPHRFAKSPVVGHGKSFVWMQRIAVARQGGNVQAARLEQLEELTAGALAREQFVNRTMVCAGISASPEFDALHADVRKIIECLLQLCGSEDDGKEADF